ncbi:MAG: SAM-dependent methyltransferase [Acholeplasmataceae bacterium]|nr:SAM-dependent methyltransferase [Acholeplasmataceae bacterium]
MARSKRIEFLADLTRGYNKVLDIGTDHGLVLSSAFEKGYIKSAIASDLREKPLNQAKKNLRKYPISYVISDGFSDIKEEFDLAIIAGMGAYLITNILDHAPSGHHEYLLQANDKIEILRTYLMNNGFSIVDEFIIHDRFYYVILKVIRGKMILNEDDILLGPILKSKPEAKPYYQRKARQIEKIMVNADEKRVESLKKMHKIYKNHIL